MYINCVYIDNNKIHNIIYKIDFNNNIKKNIFIKRINKLFFFSNKV